MLPYRYPSLALAFALVATASSQELAWRRSPFGNTFSATWDPSAGRVFLFAQRPFQWNGARWLPRGEGPTPNWYQRVRTATDTASGRMYLLGGFYDAQLSVQLWCHDGDGWTRLPLGAYGVPLLAYDSARRELMVVAPTDRRHNPLPYTYLYGERGWRLVQSVPGTGTSWPDSITFDESRGRAVAVSVPHLLTAPNETWEWDGTTWTQRAEDGLGIQRHGLALGYDPTRGRVQAYGGIPTARFEVLRDHYEWDGTTWRARSPGAGPGLGIASLVHDPDRRRMLAVGVGELGYETWQEVDGQWTRLHSESPLLALAYDSDRSVLVGAMLNGVNEWDGLEWHYRPGTGATPPRRGGVRYDVQRSRLVLVGGYDAYLQLNETWEWDGRAWERKALGSPLPRLQGFGLTYDQGRGQIVVFGGKEANTYHNELWAWDGRTWSVVPTNQLVPPRAGAGLVYDESRASLVLVGGEDARTSWRDMWQLVGGQWQEIRLTEPVPYGAFAPTYDARRRQLVMFDRYQPYEFDGARWRPVPIDMPMYGGPVFDAARGAIVIPDGVGMMLYGDVRQGGWVSLREDCPAPASPRTRAAGYAVLGERDFELELDEAPIDAPAVFLVGTQRGTTPLPRGCPLDIDPVGLVAVLPAIRGAGSVHRASLQLPSQQAWAGITFFAQAVVLDPAGPIGSSAIAVTVGN